MTTMTSIDESGRLPSGRDYRPTLNVTLKDSEPGAFPQRGNLPVREPGILRRWEETGLYRQSLDRPAPAGPFVLHDGPPYSNGNIHLGHALNKIAKDFVTRLKMMQGHCAPYVPGWDNHGMPIENAVVREFRLHGEQPDRVTLRRACRRYAEQWIDTQREQFKRLGVRGDWDNPYLTMSREFEATIVGVFGEFVESGYIYRGLRPTLWCAGCETALADAEIEYANHTSSSITVRFPLASDALGRLPEGQPVYALIWTTTPWTIPANLALAVHPDVEYALAAVTLPEGSRVSYLVATPLLTAVGEAIGADLSEVTGVWKGADLAGVVFRHPLFQREAPVVTADYVTVDAGTGIVHTAPGHGKEDFDTGQRFGLDVLCPVDSAGRYTPQAGEVFGEPLTGLRVVAEEGEGESRANSAILRALQEAGALLSHTHFEHSYPHCWRCHMPLIFRATVQWFLSIDHDGHRQKCLDAIGGVTWYPPESENRIRSMVESRPDWCVSRQRSWGVGIPAFYCDACDEAIVSRDAVAAVEALVRAEGSDAWYSAPPESILPAGFTCPGCGAPAAGLRKETDVLDVWFDSGSTNRAVLEDRARWPELTWPADLYLEGGDQHRGWFNSSLMVGVGTRAAAPYRAVITSGWTLDEEGFAMHKSAGNVVDPQDVIDRYGADVLRWWVASSDFMSDVGCGANLLQQVADSYRRIRNTFRFLVNNLADFRVEEHAVATAALEDPDRWILERLNEVTETALNAYNSYAFHRAYHAAHNFCAVDLSAVYLSAVKDRLYASAAHAPERRSAQTAMHRVAETLSRLLAPMLVFTTEEVWDYIHLPDKPASVSLAMLPQAQPADTALLSDWTRLLELRDEVNRTLEAEKRDGKFSNPLEARVTIRCDHDLARVLALREAHLPALFGVSQVGVAEAAGELEVTVGAAAGIRCARCWLVKSDVGEAAPELCRRCAEAVAVWDGERAGGVA
ncbi:MAG: isoleucine--tRNA ligase [Armatimonadetes bacterium]|nr:isoleucine--tRNA ligase [Armatimonadota bacterium]MDE2205336.1 isoleucine--tRNA ligase [Armatimonadota bacterium]